MITEVIFDIETKKIFDEIQSDNLAELEASIVSVYKRTLDDQGQEIEGLMSSFWDNELNQMWPLFANVDRVVGFNSIRFDVPVIAHLCPYDFRKIPHFDILEKIKDKLGFRIGLNSIATHTIGHSKSDVGLNAPLYWQQHTPESLKKLKDYCEMDVLVTKEVYDYGRLHGHLKYVDKWNTPRIVEIDFSYPKNIGHDQIGLF